MKSLDPKNPQQTSDTKENFNSRMLFLKAFDYINKAIDKEEKKIKGVMKDEQSIHSGDPSHKRQE